MLIVNCARGGLVDEAALRRRLESGHIGGAAFDVFVEEPAKANVLFGAPNFIATPHLGAATGEAQENVALQVAEQMSDYPAHRRGRQRAEQPLDQRRRGAQAAPVRGPRRAAGRLRRADGRQGLTGSRSPSRARWRG